jgi:pimeloyl-ACP methyl ester carboxylesterase/predicted glycosyltransferase
VEHTDEMKAEQWQARTPDQTGVVRRDGVSLAYEVFGDGETTLLLMPTWQIVHSRFWKLQIGYLARHYRVVTFDGRGTGRSSRPTGAAAYSNDECAEDAIAVLDATGTDKAVLVALSCGAAWSVLAAAEHPDRVLGIFALSPACGFRIVQSHRDGFSWQDRLDTTQGWAKYNRHYWLEGDYDDFLRFFFDQMFSEAHSTKQIEDCVGWGHEISPATLVDATAGRLGCDGAFCSDIEAACVAVHCPVTVVHGTDDHVRSQAYGERLAELTGGSLVLVEGGGHGLQARDPVLVNGLIREFADTVQPPVQRRTFVHAANRPKRALYLSSPIGLGHAQRDVAIAGELRKLQPGLQVDWLAQHPVTRLLTDHGERVHPASDWLLSESGHVEHESGEHDLHAFQAIRRMDEILVNNFMAFSDVVTAEHYDLVIGDEAWDVDYFLHENPELKRFAFAWMTDFVGWLPMPDGGSSEAALTTDYNAEMIEQRARYRRVRDRSVFVGDPDDVLDVPFGPGLPSIKAWTEQNFDFAGYVTGFDPEAQRDDGRLRSRLGVGPDDRLCIVTVGGSGVGAPLLRRVLDAVPLARRLVPDLRFVVVTGPRIDPRSLPRRRGTKVVGYLPDLYRHLAACDLAVVQGGLTTCMELTAYRKPFVYGPLRHHFEQNFHVRHRLERYEAGRCVDYDEASDPDALAEVIAKELQREVAYRPVAGDGAARAAAMLAELL